MIIEIVIFPTEKGDFPLFFVCLPGRVAIVWGPRIVRIFQCHHCPKASPSDCPGDGEMVGVHLIKVSPVVRCYLIDIPSNYIEFHLTITSALLVSW